MLRILIAAFAFSALSTSAMSHPDPKSETPKSITTMERPQLPSKSDIQDALKQMPDMNAIMGDMMGLMKDKSFRDNMESSAQAFSDRLERSKVLEDSKDGMPDFNNAFAVMLESFSDEKTMGGMLDTMMGLANAMEKHVPKTENKPAKKAVKPNVTPTLEELQDEVEDLRAQINRLREQKSAH